MRGGGNCRGEEGLWRGAGDGSGGCGLSVGGQGLGRGLDVGMGEL